MSWADNAGKQIDKAVEAGKLGAEGAWQSMGKWHRRALELARRFEDYRGEASKALNDLSNDTDRVRHAQAELLAEIGRLRTENERLKQKHGQAETRVAKAVVSVAKAVVSEVTDQEAALALHEFADAINQVLVQNKESMAAIVGTLMLRKLWVASGGGGAAYALHDPGNEGGFYLMCVVVIRDSNAPPDALRIVSSPP